MEFLLDLTTDYRTQFGRQAILHTVTPPAGYPEDRAHTIKRPEEYGGLLQITFIGEVLSALVYRKDRVIDGENLRLLLGYDLTEHIVKAEQCRVTPIQVSTTQLRYWREIVALERRHAHDRQRSRNTFLAMQQQAHITR